MAQDKNKDKDKDKELNTLLKINLIKCLVVEKQYLSLLQTLFDYNNCKKTFFYLFFLLKLIS